MEYFIFPPNDRRVCFVVGVIFSSTMTNTVQCAVKAVLICYADHPGKMHENHPQDTQDLADAIALVFPEVQIFEFSEQDAAAVVV